MKIFSVVPGQMGSKHPARDFTRAGIPGLCSLTKYQVLLSDSHNACKNHSWRTFNTWDKALYNSDTITVHSCRCRRPKIQKKYFLNMLLLLLYFNDTLQKRVKKLGHIIRLLLVNIQPKINANCLNRFYQVFLDLGCGTQSALWMLLSK